MNLNFTPVETEAQIRVAYPLMQEVYPELDFATFSKRLERAQKVIYRLHLVYDGADLVGMAAISRFGNMLAGDVMYLEEMAVAADKQGQGYGKAIIEQVRAIAAKEGRVAVYTDDATPQGSRGSFLTKSGAQKISDFYEFRIAA